MIMQDYEKKHLDLLYDGLAECMVLLKSNGDFPITEAGKIALYGNGVRNTIKGGTGSGEVNSRFFESVEEGFRKAQITITTNDWLDAYEVERLKAQQNFIKEVKLRAKKNHSSALTEGMGAVMPEPEYHIPIEGTGDAAIYVLARISGEGSDRKAISGDLLLTNTEQRDILALSKKYKKFMLALNVGGPVDLTPVMEVENILILSQLGVQTGSALVDVVLGKSYPSGKLTTTWTTYQDYPTFADFGNIVDTNYKEGIYVGYRYFDTAGVRPLFPFGFGLTYTTFSIDAQIQIEGTNVIGFADVSNTGERSGKEVVQVYVSPPEKKLDQPYQVLATWCKTDEILPGLTQKTQMSFDLKDIASFDQEKAAYVLEAGEYIIRIGNHSQNTKACAKIILIEDVIVRQVRNAISDPGFCDWVPSKSDLGSAQNSIDSNLPCLTMEAALFNNEVITYNKEWDVDEVIKTLSDEELVHLNIGAFKSKGGVLSVIGNASSSVAGAAGETANVADISPIVMADGPAGLRLNQRFYRDEKGIHGLGSIIPESMLEFIPKPLRFLMNLVSPKEKKGMQVEYQYATAIPIGTAIAQSWNLDFAQTCGDIVGAEMERFHIHLWLAPALNIHRNILCGRNFEYFSEDPLLSGLFASSLTHGVQMHTGCGTTIKHYAANNQETNRYSNNSKVSERALREIYLKGFEICIRKSHPKALMTSYNLLNGTHTSEHRELTEDILRQEFNYEGLVMTDWIIDGLSRPKNSAYPGPEAYKVASVGGDVFMPGGKRDYDNILDALREKKIKRKQLEINATRIYRTSRELVK